MVLQRTYRTNDSLSRSFGIGTTDQYEMFMVGDTGPWTYQELILPNGSRIHFYRTSSGTSYANAVYAHTSTNTTWYGATIAYNTSVFPGASWVLTTRKGDNYYFPDGYGQTNPAHMALLGMRDRYGNSITINRDANGNLIQIISPNGRYITFQHDSHNRITQAQDNIGRTVTYTYDVSGRLATVTDANGGVTTYTYNSNNNILTINDPRQIEYLTNTYDSTGHVTKQTFPDGSTYQFAWTLATSTTLTYSTSGSTSPGGSASQVLAFRSCTSCSEGYMPLVSQVDVTDARGIIRRVNFGSTGQKVSDIYAFGQPEQETFTYTYYPDNLLQSVTEQLGRTTSYSYDANGNVTQITKLAGTPNAVTTSFTYDPTVNALTSIIDPLGHTSSFTIDIFGNTSAFTDSLNHKTSFGYNSQGQLTSVTDPLGQTTQLQYTWGGLTAITDPLGNTASEFRDAVGRLVSITNATGKITKYTYDNLNQLIGLIDQLNGQTPFTYDPNDNLSSVSDALGHTTSYTFDSMDRRVTRQDPLQRVENYQ